MTSREWMECLKDNLFENGFTLSWMDFGDGYFIFDHGEESVCHFGIKQIPNYRWGVWFSFDKENKKQITEAWIFVRHNDDLDKFKPTRSNFQMKYTVKPNISKEDYPDWEMYWVKNLCKQFKKHPLISYYQVNYDTIITNNIFKIYIHYRFDAIKTKIRDWYLYDTKKFNLTYRKLLKIQKCLEKDYYDDIESVTLHDDADDGWRSTPRFTLKIATKGEDVDIRTFILPFYRPTGKPVLSHNQSEIIWKLKDDDGRYFDLRPTEEEMISAYGIWYKIFKRKKYSERLFKE